MDYGERRKPKTAWIFPTGIGVFAVIAVLIVGRLSYIGLRAQSVEDQYWNVAGPPCPSLSQAAFQAQPIKPLQRFRMANVVFGRAYGYASCGQLPTTGGFGARVVCEFTNPGILTIGSPAGQTYFAPGLAHPATVSVDSSGARCVLGANYKGD